VHSTRASCIADRLEFDYHVLLLDGHRHRLGDIRALDHVGASGNLRRIGPRPHLGRLAPGLAGADIELPAVPGATYHLDLTEHAELARLVTDRKAGDEAIAQASALVRTPVKQAVEFTAEIEDADRPSADREHFVGARRDLGDGSNDVSSHG